MEYLVQHSDSTALILMDRSGPVDYLDMLREVAPEVDAGDAANLRPATFPALRNVIVWGESPPAGVIGWDTMLAGAEAVPASELARREAAVSPDDTFLLMYTSGTTGFPKGVMHCHNPIRTITDAANRMGMSSRDVILMYLPLFHCFGLYEIDRSNRRTILLAVGMASSSLEARRTQADTGMLPNRNLNQDRPDTRTAACKAPRKSRRA